MTVFNVFIRKYRYALLAVLVIAAMFIALQIAAWATAVYAAEDQFIYLPIIQKPAQVIDTSNQIKNSSFENGWTDMPPAAGNLINQQPLEWTLFLIEVGDPLFDDANTLAEGTPESIHKKSDQLPPQEQPGGATPLILEGDYVYKTFHFGSPFGTELRQTVTGLPSGAEMRITVPLQVHLHGETDKYGAETSLWINDVGGWANGFEMGDRRWCKHEQLADVPANGELEVVVRMKSKWASAKDFFIDDVYMLPSSEPSPYPHMPPCTSSLRLERYQAAVK